MDTPLKRRHSSFKTVEEKYIARIKARRLFKAAFHRVVTHLQWLLSDERKSVFHTADLCSYEAKCLLIKPIKDRTPADLHQLKKLIYNTKVLKQYPMHVRRSLACVTYLNCFGPNRILTKQNNKATMYYFLIDGKIRVTHETLDTLLNKIVVEEKKTLLPGSGFGDISMLNDTPHNTTKTTLTDVMVLCINKDDFENVLDKTVKDMWDEIKEQFRIIPYFQQYNQKEITELLITSRILKFQPDEIILGDQKGFKNLTYIILNGTCRMIENLQVIPHRTVLSTTYTLYKPKVDAMINVDQDFSSVECQNSSNTESLSYKKNIRHFKHKKLKEATSNTMPPCVETHFMQLCTMKYGSTFNIGENLTNRRIVAITPVKCLTVPKYWILSHDKSKTWVSLSQLLDRQIPNTKQIFEEFKNQQKWLKYRESLQNDILSVHYYPSYNTVHNIPPFYRVENEVPSD